uniref:Macro domain-containing protein n=1 Tax=Rhizochromulina marina TaxID=1034831 RepID=A0A7S2WMU9_9STRA|mmetsp:Transcript_28080/g.82250  ORF Transcript_28080/g.82250 Transcript_28080/m.82250 type:complete len:462 (+) Transcript_28080:175-1560(+)
MNRRITSFYGPREKKHKKTDWFENLFGFPEKKGYDHVQGQLSVKGKTLRSAANGRSFSIGTFETPSLGELRKRAVPRLEEAVGTLKLKLVSGDVSLFHGEEDNRFATFQAASQFNCLEFVSPVNTPEQGITKYTEDKTQGPACAIACAPATLYRNYFLPFPTVATSSSASSSTSSKGPVGQRNARQLNNAAEMLELLLDGDESDEMFVEGGYLLATDEVLEAVNRRLPDVDLEELKEAVRVGLHRDVQVTSTNWGKTPVDEEEQLVTQIFCSACPVSYSGNPVYLWETLATIVLEAAYEATLLSALENRLRHGGAAGSRRVYLTALGAGAFGNLMSWVVNALRRALDVVQGTDLEVYIVAYGKPDKRLLKLVKDFKTSTSTSGGSPAKEAPAASAAAASPRRHPAFSPSPHKAASSPSSSSTSPKKHHRSRDAGSEGDERRAPRMRLPLSPPAAAASSSSK